MVVKFEGHKTLATAGRRHVTSERLFSSMSSREIQEWSRI